MISVTYIYRISVNTSDTCRLDVGDYFTIIVADELENIKQLLRPSYMPITRDLEGDRHIKIFVTNRISSATIDSTNSNLVPLYI